LCHQTLQIMEILGYIASIAIGISLGLIGSGGSILTVPVLVYLFGINPLIATSYSLFIVGISSLVGAYPKYKQKLISFKTAFVFAIPSLISVFVTRTFILPLVPNHIGSINTFEITKPILVMVSFAILMIAASISMIREKKCINCPDEPEDLDFNYPLIIFEGLAIGFLTGFVGAGGGFLIIPALVMFSKLTMKRAIGTSLTIIAINSSIGFLASMITHHAHLQYQLLFTVTTLAIVGIFIGNQLSKNIDGFKLKKGFGVFVLVMGTYIVWRELMN
jgi:uncharacterized membrane protein YfcA